MGNILLDRRHKIYGARSGQLTRNLCAWRGGKPYIDIALTRYPCESDASWLGDQTRQVPSRADRTSYINYAGRIVQKINQYVLGQDVDRDGAGDVFVDDATKSGVGLSSLMEEVCSHLTVAGWCWLHADRGAPSIDPATGSKVSRSVLERERVGDRVYWQLWGATEVVDWHFAKDGALLWLITDDEVYENEDLATEAKSTRLRTIWKRGEGERIWYEGEKVTRRESFTISARRVPFVPVGLPSALPWWFDDVERVQAGLLNLESTHLESLAAAVFPQLVVPADMVPNLMNLLKMNDAAGMKLALEMVRGLNYPIMEPTDAAGLSRYIMPDKGNLQALPEEITRRRSELFEIVGLAMANKETGQVQSADSKAWDHLDPAAVMRSRAARLEEAERKMVALSMELDPTFSAYSPRYPRTFNLIDFAADINAVIALDQSVVSEKLRMELERVKANLVAQRFGLPADRRQEIMDDIGSGAMREFSTVESGAI
ncbi:MAG: hypothetical protein ABFD89_15990 [Bryobacteraceae bacterium]